MGSSFFEFSVAMSGLQAAKVGLQTTSHNISNSATKGYTRQTILQKASPAMEKFNGIGMVGTGTTIYGVGQIRDVYLDKKYWQQNSNLGEYKQKSIQLSMMESILDDLSEAGLTGQLNEFFNSLSELSSSSNDASLKVAVVNNAQAILNTVKDYANNLQKQQESINDDIYAIVTQINYLGSQIVGLNKQIYNYELDGSMANDLRDQRALLIDELSQYVNIETKTRVDSSGQEKITILVNGQEFVNHNQSRSFVCERRENPVNENDAIGLYRITWNDGMDFDIAGMSGELKGLLDVRDGDGGAGTGGSYKGVPYYMDKLNEFVRTFAISLNNGTDLNGRQLEGVIGHTQAFNSNGETGILFLSFVDENGNVNTETELDYIAQLNVFNICISNELKENSENMAILSSEDVTQESENSVVLGFVSLRENKDLFREGNIYQYVSSISSNLGVDSSHSQKFENFYTDMMDTVESQRLQVSGVSINEEMANILKYQHLYQAASKLINSINEIYNITINGLGI